MKNQIYSAFSEELGMTGVKCPKARLPHYVIAE